MDTIIKPNSLFKVSGKGMPVKEDQQKVSLTDNDQDGEYGDLIIDFTILFPTKLDTKRIDILRKIFNYTEDKKSETALVACHFKDKADVVKELMNENMDQHQIKEEGGCIQQ